MRVSELNKRLNNVELNIFLTGAVIFIATWGFIIMFDGINNIYFKAIGLSFWLGGFIAMIVGIIMFIWAK